MATLTRFEEIEAWQTGRQLADLVYDLSEQGQFAGDFGLKDRMRRAVVSAMSNIAEGFESRTQAMFLDFLGRAKGSAGEVRAQAYITLDRGYINQEQFNHLLDLAEKCSRQISRFMTYLESLSTARRVREGHVEYNLPTF